MFSKIKEITFKINSYCNLACVYCFQTTDTKELNRPFHMYDEMVDFICRLPLDSKLEFKITGGESSLFIEDIRYAWRKLRKIERYKPTRIVFTTITNGTNLEGLFELMDEGILEPESCKYSWDGIYSASKSRKPKNPMYTDEFFNSKIISLGKSKYKDDMLVRIAVTPDTVHNLYDSFKFAFDAGCSKLEYYFLTDCDTYTEDWFAEEFEKQIRLIAQLHNKHKFNYFNFDTLYYTECILPKDEKTKLRSIGCRHLGRSLYIANNGDVYPCGFFTEDSKYCSQCYRLSNITEDFDKQIVNDFIKEYMKQPMCDYQYCENLHCFECPALTKYRTGNMQHKLCQACRLRDIERQVFHEIQKDNFDEEAIRLSYSHADDWDISEDNARIRFKT